MRQINMRQIKINKAAKLTRRRGGWYLAAMLVVMSWQFGWASYASPAPAPGSPAIEPTPAADGLKVLQSWQQQMMAGGRDLSLQWEQVQYKALRDRYIKSQGKGQFSYPQRFVWDLESRGQAWIGDGKTLYHLDRRTKTALVYPAKGTQYQEVQRFVGLITRFDRLTHEYRVESFRQDATQLWFDLIPKQLGDLIKVKVVYNKGQAAIAKIQMNFSSGNYTTLNFSQQRRQPLAAAVFKLPKQVKIRHMP